MENENDGGIELLRAACSERRNELREAVQNGGDVEKSAKMFALAFNAYQEARAASLGMSVKRVSAFHVMKNLHQILSVSS